MTEQILGCGLLIILTLGAITLSRAIESRGLQALRNFEVKTRGLLPELSYGGI